MSWIYMPPWDAKVVAAIAAGLLVCAAVRWRREKRGAVLLVLRAIVIGLLLFVMLNPQALLPRDRSEKPKLIVLLDNSLSMATADVNGVTRKNAALTVLTNTSTLAALHKEFELDLRLFDGKVVPLDIATAGQVNPGNASDIKTSIMSAASEAGDARFQAGVLLISDGRATTPDTLDAAQLALARSVPLWTCVLGGPVPQHDLWIETASSEALAFDNSEIELSATLHVTGFENRSFKVEIVNDDKMLETQEVLPGTNGTARVSIRVKAPASGEHRYIFRAPAQPEESDASNNERSIFVRSVGEKVRVLLAEGQPHWDTKFLVQHLKRDSHVELTAVYRLNAMRHMAIVSSMGAETRVDDDLFPRTAEAFNAFDVIILGRGAEGFFKAETEGLLTDFVAKRGGSLVFARGKAYGGRFPALAKFEPVAWSEGSASSVKLSLTEAGRDNPIFDLGASGSLDDLMERLPALDHAGMTHGEKPLAVALAAASNQDGPVLLAYQRYGQGKTLSLNAAGLWRWAFREMGQEETETAYQRFWLSLLQWLLSSSHFLPGADVSLTSSRRYYTSDQPMQFIIGTRNIERAGYRPKLTISGSGQRVEVEPRMRGESWVAEAGAFTAGSYEVTLGNNIGNPRELTQSIEVVSASIENREISADPQLMRSLAETSGGVVISLQDVPQMGDVVKRWEAARQLAHRQIPIWDRFWLLGTILGLLGAEWWFRRREGLL